MEQIEHEVYLSLGSNLGNREDNLRKAISSIASSYQVDAISSIYNSPPYEMQAESDFLNLCLKIKTKAPSEKLLSDFQQIETSMGRIRIASNSYQSRVIDIDIIFYGTLIIESTTLQIPHAEYPKRKFVLIPLLEIAPDLIDPRNNQSVKQILENCSDPSNLSSYPENIHL